MKVCHPEGGQDSGERYSDRMLQEINLFRNVENVHDLPEIYHYWSNKYLAPKLPAIGLENVNDLYIKYIIEIVSK